MSGRSSDRSRHSRFTRAEAQPAQPLSFDGTHDRRAPGRRVATMKLARVVLPCGKRIVCVIRDVSAQGAKLNISRRHPLTEAFRLDIVRTNKRFVVECVWRRGDYAGVRLMPVNIGDTVFD